MFLLSKTAIKYSSTPNDIWDIWGQSKNPFSQFTANPKIGKQSKIDGQVMPRSFCSNTFGCLSPSPRSSD